MEEQLVEKNDRKKYVTERNGKTPENGKESSHSAHADGMNEWMNFFTFALCGNIYTDGNLKV